MGDKFDEVTGHMLAEDRIAIKEKSVLVTFQICYYIFIYFLNTKAVASAKFSAIAKHNALTQSLSYVFIPHSPTFGNPDLRKIHHVLQRFGFVFDDEAYDLICTEYSLISTACTSFFGAYCEMRKSKTLYEFYRCVDSASFPNFAALACVLCAIPVSSANVERGFSSLSRFKTKATNRLDMASTEARFIISNNLPKVKDSKVWDASYLDEFKASYIDKSFAGKEQRSFRSYLG